MSTAIRLTATTAAAAAVGAYRRWHLTWGATPDEVTAAMPGDELLPIAQFQTTRASTVDAPPAEVGPWLVQVGFGRAGFYSYDLLDNLGLPSATTLLPHWQHPWPGDIAAPMTRPATVDTAFVFGPVVENEYMIWSKPNSTWAWQLSPLVEERNRVVTRLRQRYQLTPALPITLGLMELADFPMMRQMLRGIRSRAELAAIRLSADTDVAAVSTALHRLARWIARGCDLCRAHATPGPCTARHSGCIERRLTHRRQSSLRGQRTDLVVVDDGDGAVGEVEYSVADGAEQHGA